MSDTGSGTGSDTGSGTGTTAAATGARHRLRRSLGLRDLVVYGLLFIAPMAPAGAGGR
ncbi:hypothetical protein ABZ471_22410 [Streptomyces sp. NPDC005728]|uniref:hypothetical protein n=1 Tax=Streptomyces sp. NPDC005728 TaxID=3157054 RepID=UPI0034042BBE